jgi:hypothetical protein
MSDVLPNVNNQFEGIRDEIIARMEKDADLLMFLSSKFWGEDTEGAGQECHFITKEYAIGISRKKK